MKTKAMIVLGMFGLATVLSACSQEEEMATYCVDQTGTVVDSYYCDPDSDDYNPMYLFWYSSDDHHYKKGKKIPSADFRKGTTPKPSSSAKPSTSKPSSKGSTPSASKPSAGSKPSANAPKPQAPKPQAPKPPAPKPAGKK